MPPSSVSSWVNPWCDLNRVAHGFTDIRLGDGVGFCCGQQRLQLRQVLLHLGLIGAVCGEVARLERCFRSGVVGDEPVVQVDDLLLRASRWA